MYVFCDLEKYFNNTENVAHNIVLLLFLFMLDIQAISSGCTYLIVVQE